jgi:hypothetical protein
MTTERMVGGPERSRSRHQPSAGEMAEWRHEGGRIRLEPFARLSRGARADLREEGERLAEPHA